MKEKYLQLQAAALARSLKPVDFKFSPANKEDLVKLQVDLMHLSLQKELSPDHLGPLNQGVRNLIQLIAPPQSANVNVTQQVAVDPDQIISGFLNTLPAELRNGIIAYGRKQGKLAANPPSI